jgi:hypothetical protein
MKRALKILGRRPDIGVGGGGLNRLIEKKKVVYLFILKARSTVSKNRKKEY